MDNILEKHQSYALCFIDDVCVFSNSWEDHLVHLTQVFQSIKDAGLTVKPSKAQLGFSHVKYLGHEVGSGRKSVDKFKLLLLKDFVVPTTKKELRGFLGFIGFYRSFIDNFASVASPLTDMLKKDSPNLIPWSPIADSAFQKLRDSLIEAPILRSPDFSKTFYVLVDSSENAVGGVLAQKDDREMLHPILFLSKKFNETERRYSSLERESLGVVIVVTKLRYFLLGTFFVLLVDAKPILALKNSVYDNSKLLRWSLKLSEYNYSVNYIKGREHFIPDYLSRYMHYPPESDSVSPIVENLM
jgi:RNase H-like domain found in reverse transcriptase/Reverse transcriptase (RNA-dependent DNA polymerase)